MTTTRKKTSWVKPQIEEFNTYCKAEGITIREVAEWFKNNNRKPLYTSGLSKMLKFETRTVPCNFIDDLNDYKAHYEKEKADATQSSS